MIKDICLVVVVMLLAVTLYNVNGYITEEREKNLTNDQRIELKAKKQQQMIERSQHCKNSDNSKFVYITLVIVAALILFFGLIKIAFMNSEDGFTYFFAAILFIFVVAGYKAYKIHSCAEANIYLKENG